MRVYFYWNETADTSIYEHMKAFKARFEGIA